MPEARKKTVVLFVDNFYNELEFWYPKIRLAEAGCSVIVAAREAGATYKSKIGLAAESDVSYADIDPETVDALVIPGGYAPDYMRRDKDCLALVRAVHEAGRPVAFICHAGWVPISAGIVKGRRATSVSAIRDDMVNAGALWEDSPVVVDGNLVTSRTPDDLPQFMTALLALL